MADFDPHQTPTGTYRPGAIRDANLQAILEAAEAEFVRHGYRGASFQGIADRAGLPKANVQYYFQRKSYLYLSVLNRIVELWNRQFDQIRADDDPAEALDGFIRTKVRLAFEQPQASKLFAQEIIAGAPHLAQFIASDMRSWLEARERVIRSWIEEDRMAPVEPRLLIFLIWSSTQHYADFDAQVLPLLDRRAYDGELQRRVADFLSAQILRGCGLEPPARGRLGAGSSDGNAAP